MSRMADSKPRRPRRQFDEEFKAQAVRLVLEERKSIGTLARDHEQPIAANVLDR